MTASATVRCRCGRRLIRDEVFGVDVCVYSRLVAEACDSDSLTDLPVAVFDAAPGHTHTWTYHPPATVGAEGVRACPCGMYADPLPSDGDALLLEPLRAGLRATPPAAFVTPDTS